MNQNYYGYPGPYGPSDYYRDARQFPDYPAPAPVPAPTYQNGSQNYQPAPPAPSAAPTQPPQNRKIIRVPGPKYVHDYIMQPNDQEIFIDANYPIMYIKESDKLGTGVTTAYNMTEINFEELLNSENGVSFENLMVTREEFDELKNDLSRLSERFDRMDQDNRSPKQNYNKKPNREESK